MGAKGAFEHHGKANSECERKFWSERFELCNEICKELGGDVRYLTLHAARTRTINFAHQILKLRNIWGLGSIAKAVLRFIVLRFERKNEKFFLRVLQEVQPMLGEVDYAYDLYTGIAQLPKLMRRRGISWHVTGIELVPELAVIASSYARIEVEEGFAHEELGKIQRWSVQVFTVICGFLHSSDTEVELSLLRIQEILPPGGHLVICEMLAEDKPKRRPTNPGTRYRSLRWYESRLPYMALQHFSSQPLIKEGDKCRVLVFQMTGFPTQRQQGGFDG